MRVKEEMLRSLETLGFEDKSLYCDDDTHTYYEKHFGYKHFIRVGSPYVESTNIEFYYDPDVRAVPEEITACVPIWAFPTMVKMVQMGFIDEEE